jgi:outer membrane receptor for Fe3+-dicitrate
MMIAIPAPLAGQPGWVRGTVRHATSGGPVPNAIVAWEGEPGTGVVTTAEGRFRIRPTAGQGRLTVLAIGFRPDTVPAPGDRPLEVRLDPAPLTLAPLVVAAARAVSPELAARVVDDLDFALSAPSSSPELLRFAPGLALAQHAGGGKAEQIFLRGFDADHGTDVAISVDGVPVNMVSHAHGQG